MIMPKMIYDIRTTEYAQKTLSNLTGVPISVWKQYLGREHEYEYIDDLVADVINSHGYLPRSYKDLVLIYFHVTTSANECASFRKHGILDLKQSYSCHDSELRAFLEKHDIHIDLDEKMLIYCGRRFDITFGACPKQDTVAYKCWSIGRKFYFDYTNQIYLGSRERIANETFTLSSTVGSEYNISFAINTYNGEAARLEIAITAPETESYDQKLEDLKIALKNRLFPDWQECTWLVDEQAAALCKEAYEKAYKVENNLRAFASKVLIHFLGVNWIKKAGLEKDAESVKSLKEKFIQRVPEFDNINADFLSMTLETLTGVIFEGAIFKDNVILSRHDYAKVQEMGAKQKVTGGSVAYVAGLQSLCQPWTALCAAFFLLPLRAVSAIGGFLCVAKSV